MKVKRIMCIVMTLALSVGLCACTGKGKSVNTQSEPDMETTNDSVNTSHLKMNPLEHLIIDAEVEKPDYDEYGTYILHLSLPATADITDRFFCGTKIETINNDNNSMYLASADGSEFSCNKYGLSFYAPERSKWTEMASIMNYYVDDDYDGATTSLNYMTEEEVVELVKKTMKECAVDFTLVVTKCICMKHTDLMALQQKLLNDPEKHYDDFGKAFKLTGLDSSDDAYFVAFSFAYNEIPIFSREEVSNVTYSVPNMLMSNGMGGEMIITDEGIKYMEIMGANFTPTISTSSKIITVDEAIEKLIEKYDVEILQSDYLYSAIYLEYMPIEKENGQIYLTPYWCFDCGTDYHGQDSNYYRSTISSTRFNAVTGENFSYGG